MGSIAPPPSSQKPDHYQIAIVGGGIAGLTLGLACAKLGIRYALFEARSNLAPAEGMAIALQDNGLRILDQLGVYEEIARHTVPMQRWTHYDENGGLLCETNAFGYQRHKFGYGMLGIERHKLLEIMAGELRRRRRGNDLIRLSCRVSTFQEDEDKVTVTTADGDVITADLLVGADGVRSSVRTFIDALQAGGHPSKSDEYMTTSFANVHGISYPVDGIAEGDGITVYREGTSLLIYTGKGGMVYWHVFEDLGETVGMSRGPRYYSGEAADAFCRLVAHVPVAPGVLFGDVYARRTAYIRLALETGIAETWHTARTVIIGDAAHKMVPHAALGGNQAMESVALLLNELLGSGSGSSSGRSGALAIIPLPALCERRCARTSKLRSMAEMTCRTQLSPHGEHTSATYRQLPGLTDADWLLKITMSFLGAPALEGVPLTERGRFYDESLASFQERFATQTYSNKAELVGLPTG
ncbi:hypothetical protein PG994_008859 [Apiospora phragmitis]|uniref:FAD-binding domain-containing protein n=1 Tax=Apiospora phragmitis TaxID=2905665 RepID=A0ABR1UHM0_9PEZI